jgi:dipeptidyl aminopeptidase/acylaminoacyl peptidase
VRDRIVIADAQGRIRRRLGRFSPDYFRYSGLAWSPDGRMLAATHYSRALSTGLTVLNADGTGGRMLVDEQGSPLGNPSWSPDGRRILFSRGSEGAATWVIDTNGANKRKLLDSASDAVWSPDGRQLAYVAYDGARVAGLAVARADGSDARLLTQGIVDGPAWSPDGRTIAFTRRTLDSLPLRIALIKPDGTGERTVPTGNLVGGRPSDVTWRRSAPLPANRRPCVINGTARADVIRGTDRGDVIVGGAGDDTIYGAGGNDLLVGAGGRDRLHGGRGNDYFLAEDRARDVVFGGPGRDAGHFDPRLDRLISIERRR